MQEMASPDPYQPPPRWSIQTADHSGNGWEPIPFSITDDPLEVIETYYVVVSRFPALPVAIFDERGEGKPLTVDCVLDLIDD